MMAKPESDIEPFAKFVEAIEPWLGEMVLVGGWAHRLYRSDPRARNLGYVPLTTLGEMSPFRENSRSKSRQFGSA
jgi:hypothetical protein